MRCQGCRVEIRFVRIEVRVVGLRSGVVRVVVRVVGVEAGNKVKRKGCGGEVRFDRVAVRGG